MALYRLFFKRSAEKELRKIAPRDVRKVIQAVQALARDPRPPGVRLLKGPERYWRARQGNYRIIYEIDDEVTQITIIKIGHRREVYED